MKGDRNLRFRIESNVVSHAGCVRPVNEDNFCNRPLDGLWAVADGMGGHANGRWASSVIANNLINVELPDDFDTACKNIADCIHAANSVIWEKSQELEEQMGSTVVVLFVRDNMFVIFWIGDSRSYLLRREELVRLSKDHTRVQDMVDKGLLSEDEVDSHPLGHILARAVGVQETVELDVVSDVIESGDRFLICSDGLTGPINDDEIRKILLSMNLQLAVDHMLQETLDRGAPDNVTIAAVIANEMTSLSFAPVRGSSAL
jgi:serine/threonine protein phosphatase PrpC